MAQFPDLTETGQLTAQDEILLRQGVSDKRIEFSLASAIAWGARNNYTFIGKYTGDGIFNTSRDYTYFEGKVYSVKEGVILPYQIDSATYPTPQQDPNLQAFVSNDYGELPNGTQVKRRRGTRTEHESFTGAIGEITVNTTDNVPHVHDGVTQGGHRPEIKPLNNVSEIPLLPKMIGAKVSWLGYYTASDGGSNWGIIKSGAHTADGGSIFSIDASTYVEANLNGKKLNAKKFGLKGNYVDDDKERLVALWDYAPWGSTILYPEGQYKIDGGHTHPLKQLYHYGVGETPSFVPDGTLRGGTSFFFPTYTAITKGGIYMPPPNGAEFCRFSSFNDMTFFGNGTDDNTGNVTCLKINNLGTNLSNFSSRYGAVSIECNYSVGARWENLKLISSTYSATFVYDVATPFGLEKNSVATQNHFDSIMCATSRTNINAIGWYVDATCSYGGNSHAVWDMESCYTGAKFEGRVSSKDHDGLSVYGAASWQSSGNTFISAWFERNVGDNLVLSYDPSQQEPALSFDGIYEDETKITSADDAKSLVKRPNSIVPLFLGSGDESQGNIGQLGNPFTGGQYLIHGAEINTPHKRSLVDSRIPHQTANRPTFNTNSSFDFDAFVPNVPIVGASINVANVTLGNTTQSATVEVTAVGTGNTGGQYVTFSKYLVENNNDSIASVAVQEVGSGGIIPLQFQAIRTGINTFGLFVWKNAALTSVLYATFSFKIVIGGASTGGNQANLSILI